MDTTLKHKTRVREQLRAAGMTSYGLQKSESRAMHDHIHPNEDILAVIYGQFEGTSAMMVATDKRILFLDVRAMHNVVEETSYETFGDLQVDEGIKFSRVTLRTKPRDYEFHLVNRQCARRFLNVVEDMALNDRRNLPHISSQIAAEIKQHESNLSAFQKTSPATPEEIDFLHRHYIATLSTRGEDGYPHGVTVFYFYDKENPDTIFTITKSSTASATNLRRNNKVAFTVTDTSIMATMHINAIAEVEKKTNVRNYIIGLLFKHARKLSRAEMPPVAQLKDGSFVIYRNHIKQVSLRQYL